MKETTWGGWGGSEEKTQFQIEGIPSPLLDKLNEMQKQMHYHQSTEYRKKNLDDIKEEKTVHL